MNTLSFIIMTVVQGAILGITIYLYWKVFTFENKNNEKEESFSDDEF